jgi:hypothetical protein
MYCGLDIPEILEAAHVIPDSEGGAASTENIRVLCANHHTALDAGLIVIDGDEFIPAKGAREVPPRRPIAIAIPEPKDPPAGDADEDVELDEDDRYGWIHADPYELTPNRLGDEVMYFDDTGLHVEGTLLGIRFLSKDPSHPLDITYELDIHSIDEGEAVTVTLSADGNLSRYIDTEDPEAW